MGYFIISTNQYNRSFKKLIFGGKVRREEIEKVIEIIISNSKLPFKFKDHKLKGDMADFRECHIKPNILLIYKIKRDGTTLILVNIGTHSDLFGN